MTSHTLDELIADGVLGRRVLVRSDLNVPLDGFTVTDDGRVRASIPVVQKLAEAGARVIVMAHLGRPKGEPDPKYSIAPAATQLAELSGLDVRTAADVVGPSARKLAGELDRRSGAGAGKRALRCPRDLQGRCGSAPNSRPSSPR